MWTRRTDQRDEELVRQRLRTLTPPPDLSFAPDASAAPDRRSVPDRADPPDLPVPSGVAWSGAPRPGRVVAGRSGEGDGPPGDGAGADRASGAAGAGSELAGGRASLGAFDPGRRGLRALLAVAAVVVVIAGYLFWRGQPRVEPVPPAAPPTVGAATGSGSGAVIVVAVSGRVVHPGLFRLPAGARVQDAIDAAGGVLPGTDLTMVNLARKLADGELVAIGLTAAPADPAGDAGTGGGAVGGKVNINTAGVSQLDTLPGIGPALAQRIVEYRAAHGGFRSVDELRKVEGIGDAKYAELKDLVTV